MNGTPTVEIPGWYINFLAAVIKQLPRPGQLDQATAEGWEKNQESLKKTLAGSLLPSPVEVQDKGGESSERSQSKFTLVKTIQVTVPKDYDHVTHLTEFSKNNRAKFFGYNDNITDENFAQVTHKLVPGKTYLVKIFGINRGEVPTSDECLTKYQMEKAYLVGAQGASLVWEQKRNQLPKGNWYVSFDEKKNLPVADGCHGVPYVFAHSDGGFGFSLGGFEGGWRDDICLLCFCDPPATAGGE